MKIDDTVKDQVRRQVRKQLLTQCVDSIPRIILMQAYNQIPSKVFKKFYNTQIYHQAEEHL